MNAAKIIALAIALVIVAVIAVRLTKSAAPLTAPGTASSYGSGAPRNLPADAVLAIAPGSGASSQTHRPVSVLSPVLSEFAHAKSYKPLYDRLRPASSRTPEEAWILATILKDCGKQPNKKQDDAANAIPDDVAIARFAAALPARDPAREKRLAAYSDARVGHCGDLKDLQTTPEAIRALLAEAATAGDPKAAAALVRHDLWAPFEAADRTKFSFTTAPWPAISAAQIGELQHAAESGDPYALVIAAQTLRGPFTNMSLQNAQDGRPMDAGSFITAAELLACDAGYPCGPDNRQLQYGCAYQGQCDAQTLREYMFFYGLPPDASQRVAEYQTMLTRAVRDHDWSGITFHPGPALFLAPYVKP